MNTVYIIFNKSQLVDFYGLHRTGFCVIMHLNGQISIFGGGLPMDFLYAVMNPEELQKFRTFSDQIQIRLQSYLDILEDRYRVTDLPGCIVLASAKTATERISNIPLPAYTNELRTVFCPELPAWCAFYLQQLDGSELPEVRHYYETMLTENHILQILGHEFVHHSELFLDEAYESARWFEEGMCEYISRRFFLTEEQFQEEARINDLLVEAYDRKWGNHPLEGFCADTYEGSYASIFHFYWISFLAVNRIIQHYNDDIMAVFQAYHRWFESGMSCPLSEWFHIV